MLNIWDWLTGWIAAGHLQRWLDGLLQPYSVLCTSPRISPCLGHSPLVCFACRWLCSSSACCWLCSSACCWHCSSACCWHCSSRFFSSYLPFWTTERCSASASSLRCTYFSLSSYPCCFTPFFFFSPLTLWLWFRLGLSPLAHWAVALSLILSRDTLW